MRLEKREVCKTKEFSLVSTTRYLQHITIFHKPSNMHEVMNNSISKTEFCVYLDRYICILDQKAYFGNKHQ